MAADLPAVVHEGYTPGPWQWFGNARTDDFYLATVLNGRIFVMGFDRCGMQGAQPRFRQNHRMVPAKDLALFEVGDRGVVGYEAAKADPSVYRYDIVGFDSADAKLIADAPRLYEETVRLTAQLKAAQDENKRLRETGQRISKMYTNTWDRVDGALVMMGDGVDEFEAAREQLFDALASAEAGDGK